MFGAIYMKHPDGSFQSHVPAARLVMAYPSSLDCGTGEILRDDSGEILEVPRLSPGFHVHRCVKPPGTAMPLPCGRSPPGARGPMLGEAP